MPSVTDVPLVGISTVTMQRLPVNGMNLELVQELSRIFDTLEKDNSRGMILTSVSELPSNWVTDRRSGGDDMCHLILELVQHSSNCICLNTRCCFFIVSYFQENVCTEHA